MILDTLDSSPRLRLSDNQMQLIMFGMSELGVRDVPALSTFRNMQKALRRKIAVPTEEHRSSRGNVFYVNNIGALIAKDFANPLIRPFIHLYPERNNGVVNEVWQASKWADELGPDHLTPMAKGLKKQHFYVHELARTKDGQYFIPKKWFTIKDKLHCECSLVLLQNVRPMSPRIMKRLMEFRHISRVVCSA